MPRKKTRQQGKRPKSVSASGKNEKKAERVALHKNGEVKPDQLIPMEEEFREF